jgi:hypothetical protein
MRSIFYIGFAMLMVQWVCSDTSTDNKKKEESISCMPGSLQALHTLNWRQPTIHFNISLDLLKKINGILSVWVKEIKNPGLVPVNFKLLFSDSLRQWPLTGFTLYPPDKTGVFNFNISETVKNILTTGGTAKNKQYIFRIILDTAGFYKQNKAEVELLQIKVCSPVFK